MSIYNACSFHPSNSQFTNEWESPNTPVQSCAMAKLNETGSAQSSK